jgi:penicillin-binding protein 1C
VSPGLRRRALLALAAALLAWGGWHLYRAGAGEPTAQLGARWHESTKILDRHGRVLRDLPSDLGVRGEPLALEAIGDRLMLATLAAEDKRFFDHGGVDGAAVLRALGQNARHVRVVSGASTITQQLVKLLDNGGEQPLDRGIDDKLRETARAQNLEELMSKREILEAYLNRLPYGSGLTGPAAAAQGMFGVAPRDLSWAQAALLAVLPRAPSYLDPYDHLDRARERQRHLLDVLRDQGWLDEADHRRALAEPIELRPVAQAFEAPHLSEALRTGAIAAPRAASGIQTTIDGDLERDLQGMVTSHRVRLAKRADSAAVIVVDNASGEVLAYLGSAEWSDDSIKGKIDMVRAPRQPGSALKPFVYALAFERGMQPTHMLADVPTRYHDPSGRYAPGNFDGTFFGPVSAREALAGSLNVPAVRVMADLPDGALYQRLRALGVTSLDRGAGHYGLALALGSGEVTLWELAQAYLALARGGDAVPLVIAVEDAAALGRPIERGEARIEREAAAAIADSLSDPLARVRGLGGSGPFEIGFAVAVKTGTSSGFRDSWTVGFTRERTVAVWVGNPDGRATTELTGGSGAGPLFADVMRRAMADVSTKMPLYDEGLLVEARVCPLSGKPVSSACPEAVVRRVMASQAHDGERCELHHHASSRAGDPPLRCDAQGSDRVVALPPSFDAWLASQPSGAPGRDALGLSWYPASALPGCRAARVAAIAIEEPAPGAVLLASSDGESEVALAASVSGGGGQAVAFVVDGRVVATTRPPYRASVAMRRGDHVLEVRPVDPALEMVPARGRFSLR